MKTKARKVWSLIIALIVAGLMTVGYIFAWLVDRLESDLRLKGLSEGAYFDSGNGSEETPFVIANPTHMHNLAVLQNMGRFVDENGNPKKYYFEIKKTVDTINMSGTDYEYIPPIGNDENPFIGDFNGNGKTIANFTVTTDKEKLKTGFPLHAAADYEFSNAVGLFGMTGEESNIHNVILETPKVEVASTNTKYSDGANTVVGLAVGHVAGMCQSVGVRTTSTTALDVKRVVTGTDKGYSTFNSILGELASNVMTSVTGSAGALGSGGSGNAFGATFDVEGMYDRLGAIDVNKKSATPAWRLPELDTSKNDGITLRTHEKLPFTVTSESTYKGADATEVIGSSNIGYLLGNQNKVYDKKVTFGDKLIAPGGTNVSDWHFPDGSTPAKTTAGKDNKTIPRWIYRITATDVASDAYNDYTGFSPLSDAEYNSLSEDLLKLIPKENGQVLGFNSIRISQTYQNDNIQVFPGSTSNGQWSPHGQISWMGNTYGEGFTQGLHNGKETTDKDGIARYLGDAVDENGVRYTKEGYRLDENGYLFDYDSGYFPDSEDWTLKIYSVDAQGNAKNENGEYYFGYKLNWDDENYIYGLLDEDGYFYNEDGYVVKDLSVKVYFKNSEGYALDENGRYYDPSGGFVDENGFAKSDNGYIPDISAASYPVNQCNIDEDGYVVYGQYSGREGERYTDENGKEINAYDNYGLGTDDGVNYYLTLNGEKFTFKQYGQNQVLPAKKGVKVKVLTGEQMAEQNGAGYMYGAYVKAKTDSPVEFYRFEKGIALPNCGIWFKPSRAGKIRLVLYAESAGNGFTLIKGTRTGATKDNPFYVDYSKSGKDLTAEEVAKFTMPSWVLFYFEYEVKQEDLAAGNVEYWLMQYGTGGAYFVYLDLGASEADKADDTYLVDETKVSAVDFIYEGVKIEQDATSDLGLGNFIVASGAEMVLYNPSKTIVFFKNIQAALQLAFTRLNHDEDVGSQEKTIKLNDGITVDSNVMATYPDYVIPGGITKGTLDGVSGGTGGGTTNPVTPTVSSVTITGAPSAAMQVNDTVTLSASVNMSDSSTYSGTVSWTSSDTSVATVSNSGVVTAKAAGTATITATAGGKSKTCTITVTGGATQYHSGTYTLNAESTDSMVTNNGATETGSSWSFGGNAQTVNLALNVQEGKVITISVKGRRNSDKAEGINVYLGESNSGTKLGTIDLTSTEGEGIGTVQYTATADGYVYLALGRSAAGGTILSEITVTISDGGSVTPTPTVSSVTITGAPSAAMQVNDTVTLSASVNMSDSSTYSGTVSWTSSDTSVAEVSNSGVVTAKAAGTATITATAGGKEATCTITVTGGEVGGTVSEFVTGDAKFTANSKILSLIDGGTEIASITATADSGNPNSTSGTVKDENGETITCKRVQTNASFNLELKEGYKYTIYIVSASSGSSARNYTLKQGDTTVATAQSGGKDTYTLATMSDIQPVAGATDYVLSLDGNANIARIAIYAEKI